MQFSDQANKQGLVEDIDFFCGSTSATYAVADKTRNINEAYQRVVSLIWDTDGTWQYDDTNKSDRPIAVTDLVHNQRDYTLPSTAQKVYRVAVQGSDGNWIRLIHIDEKDVGVAMDEYLESAATPITYDLIGRSLMLYPPPSSAYCTTTSGLAVTVGRDPELFSATDTTATPGFASQFHRLLSISASLDFTKDPQTRDFLLHLKERMEKGLKTFYSSREIEGKTEIRPFGKRRWKQYK